jgi:glycine cleavage system T protein
MARLVLHPYHEKQGARFLQQGTWEIPGYYTHSGDECRAVRERVGLADLSYTGKLLIGGPDRLPFLQNIVSNDLQLLTPDKAIYNTLLSAKGKMLSAFYVSALDEAFLLEMDDAEATAQQLMRYKFRSRIKIDTPSWGRLLVAGPNARSVLTACTAKVPAEENQFLQAELHGSPAILIRRSLTGEEDYQIYIQEAGLPTLWEQLLDAGRETGIAPVGQTALETLRIEAGLPRYGVDMDDQTLPVEVGLDSEAISYTKGCYPGQEVLARIQTYGHINRKLSGLVIEGDTLPTKGDRIVVQDTDRGWITSATVSPVLKKVIAMAYLRTEVAAPGTEVEVQTAKSSHPAHVTPLPFYRRSIPS